MDKYTKYEIISGDINYFERVMNDFSKTGYSLCNFNTTVDLDGDLNYTAVMSILI